MSVIEFPLPPSELSPNNHAVHWAKKAAAAAAYKSECLVLALRALNGGAKPRYDAVRLEILYCTGHAHSTTQRTTRGLRLLRSDGRYRPKDRDNATAALKPMIDALTMAGWIKDDNADVVQGLELNLDASRAPGVIVQLVVL